MLETKIEQCHWQNKSAKKLGAVSFTVSAVKIEDTVQEFGGDRKGTKQETIIDGLTKSANKVLAESLLGQRVLISRNPLQLYLTRLPVDELKALTLPENIETLIKNSAPFATSPLSSALAQAPNTAISPQDEKRIVYGTKEFFRQIAGHLRLLHASQQDDIFEYEVVADLRPMDVASTILNSGEAIAGSDRNYTLTFGLLKPSSK